MSALTELMELLAKKAGESAGAGMDRVGAQFLSGAARPGTFQRGRDFAKTPEGLAAQFDWSAPQLVDPRRPSQGLRLPDPQDRTSAAFMFPQTLEDLHGMKGVGGGVNGIAPHIGSLPEDAKAYTFDTGPFTVGSGQGTRAYPALYGNVLNEPGAYNVKDLLSGPNSYRNNYALASAIMRDPKAGSRLLASPEQFAHLPVDVAQLAAAGPERQVGALQTEGALQTLRRINTAAGQTKDVPLSSRLQMLPAGLSSSMSPYDLGQALRALRMSDSTSLRSIGPGALRKLGIVQDTLQGRPVDPSAFRQLEFREGGLVQLRRHGGRSVDAAG